MRAHRSGTVLVGGGLAAQRCCETLRARGHDGPVTMIAAEPHVPYDRPPLSKALLAGAATDPSLRPAGWHAEHDVELRQQTRAVALDAGGREVVLRGGERLRYERLVIATGASARRIPLLCEDSGGEPGAGPLRAGVHELRTLDDARALRAALAPGLRLAVVGAGLVGLEVAATARALGAEVTVVEAAPLPLAGALGEQVGGWVADLHREHDVELALAATLVGVQGERRVEALVLADGRRLRCDMVLCAVGAAPATGWLARSGLPAAGVPVDAAGRTSLPQVWAAGDVARAYDPVVGAHVASDHWEAAARQGSAAARSMLGLPPVAPPLPSFWSDQHGVRLQCVGRPGLADHVEVRAGVRRRELAADFTRRGRLVAGVLAGRPHELPELRRRVAASQEPGPERIAA